MAVKFRYIALWILFVALEVSCEEAIEKSPPTEKTNLLVVEGILTNEYKPQKIKLSHPFLDLNGNPTPATGATLTIRQGINQSYSLTELPADSGEYFTSPFSAVFGNAYELRIQYKGKEYVARNSSIPVEPLTDLNYGRANPSSDLYRLYLNESGTSPNYIDYSIRWDGTAACTNEQPCEGRIVFYDLKSIDVNEIFKPDKSVFTFPENSIVIRRKYSVNPAYGSFLRSVLSETEWRGGVFDVARANATSNLSDGAIGFFAVSTVVSDTTRIVKKP